MARAPGAVAPASGPAASVSVKDESCQCMSFFWVIFTKLLAFFPEISFIETISVIIFN